MPTPKPPKPPKKDSVSFPTVPYRKIPKGKMKSGEPIFGMELMSDKDIMERYSPAPKGASVWNDTGVYYAGPPIRQPIPKKPKPPKGMLA